MKEKKYFFISIGLMLVSGILLCLAVMYYDFDGKVKDYKYSNKAEYENIREGLSFLEQMPIHFNIINKYFSNINNLSTKEKEEIVMAYVLKNNYMTYECGPQTDISKQICIKKSVLNSEEVLNKFDLNLQFSDSNIEIYVDDYGVNKVSTEKDLDYYKVSLGSDNTKYRLYSEFYEYKQDKDVYIFYLYQGYYNGNCKKDSELNLYDFMTGDVIYKGECNGNNYFTIAPDESINSLQLYKYELKKDENDRFYLAGYNPVKKSIR